MKITKHGQRILLILLENKTLSSSGLHAELMKQGEDLSLVTVKRAVNELLKSDSIVSLGAGRSTTYQIAPRGRVLLRLDVHQYCTLEPDKRYGQDLYQFELFDQMPEELFSETEINTLKQATATYQQRIQNLPPAIQKRELERLIVELSWKSSKIEGNTYTLLDTEKLILENITPPGHTEHETQMILNHKEAFTFLHGNLNLFKTINRANLEKLHAILVKNLDVGLGFRARPVGVLGSKYRPLDNPQQIAKAVEKLTKKIQTVSSPYEKALLALLGISYIQPFEDGNKRTSRLMANALLMAHGGAPLSYRSVDENAYREALLVFYELNSIIAFKHIFIEQYDFAARNYAVK